jgi:hypothetical protein
MWALLQETGRLLNGLIRALETKEQKSQISEQESS